MKVLITGISGLLGQEISRAIASGHDIIGLTQSSAGLGKTHFNVDISDQEAVYSTISKINPDIIIHSAALSNVDECETNPDKAMRVNALGTRNIALACQRFDTALVYISTDYAFSGTERNEKGFTEFDPIRPVSVYAQSKMHGEWFVQHLLNKFAIVRVSWLFGASRPNYVTQMADALLNKKEIIAVTDMVSAPTYVKDLAEALGQLIEKPSFGIYHLTNSGFASRYELAHTIADMMGAPKHFIKKSTLSELKLKAQRPHFSGLRNYLWELENRQPLRPWQDAVREFLATRNYL